MAEESGNDGREPVGAGSVETDTSTPVEQAESNEIVVPKADASASQAEGEIPMAEIADKEDELLPSELDEPDANKDEPIVETDEESDDVLESQAEHDEESDDSIPLAEIAGSETSESAMQIDHFCDKPGCMPLRIPIDDA